VVGATDAQARALGWDGQKGVPFHPTSLIAPQHFAAAVIRNAGYSKLAEELSKQPLAGVFV
jgi:hypothetical protein